MSITKDEDLEKDVLQDKGTEPEISTFMSKLRHQWMVCSGWCAVKDEDAIPNRNGW